MTTFSRSHIFSLPLYLTLCSRHAHTVSIPSHPSAYDTLRYLTRSNVTVRTRATLSPKIKKTQSYKCVSGSNLKCKRFRSANRKIFETAYPAISLFIMSDRFEEELCVLPALSTSCCHGFSRIFPKKCKPRLARTDLNSCALLSRQFRARRIAYDTRVRMTTELRVRTVLMDASRQVISGTPNKLLQRE